MRQAKLFKIRLVFLHLDCDADCGLVVLFPGFGFFFPRGGFSALALRGVAESSAWSGPLGPDQRSFMTDVNFSITLFELASGCIGIRCKIGKQLEKLFRLADEKAIGGERLDSFHRSALCISWANNRTGRKFSAEKRTWLRHNQIGLQRGIG